MKLANLWRLALALSVICLAVPAMAQTPTTGVIEGVIQDSDGNPIADALVTAVGSQAPTTTTSDRRGRYLFPSLPPGTYKVRAEAPGYGTVVQDEITVQINQRTAVSFVLHTGITEEVTVTSDAPLIDAKSTTTGATFTVDKYVDYIPIGRNFAQTFTLAPGVVDGGGTGSGNYSVSGSSGLENSYLVDGVNITNTGYGGIGSYNIIYGSLGTGVTYEFLDEIQVKTGGIDAEYGQATGGVVNTVVKSGTNEFTGAVSAYFEPASLQNSYKYISRTTGAVNTDEREQTDLAFSAGGPIIKDKLFYFLAYNPVSTTQQFVMGDAQFDPRFDTYPAGITRFPAVELGQQEQKRTNDNWAAKLTWYMNPNHRFEVSGFGDPSDGDAGPQNINALRFLDYAEGGGQSEISYGANNYSVKYDGVITPQFFVQAQWSRHDGTFEETSLVNKPRVRDRRQSLCYVLPLLYCGGGDPATAGTAWFNGGTGFISNATDMNDQLKVNASWILGNHELKFGVQYDDIEYTDDQAYSGEPIDFKIPLDGDGSGSYTNNTTPCDEADPGTDCYVILTSTSGASADLRWSGTTDVYRVVRTRFYPTPPPTTTKDLNFFVQDTWEVTPNWTLKLGLRATQQKIDGSGGFTLPLALDEEDYRIPQENVYAPGSYKFDWAYAPRFGVTWDIQGDGRSKAYANIGRYFERIPNDLAIRALSNEVGLTRYEWYGYDYETGTFSNPRVDTSAGNTIYFQGLETSEIAPGTKLPYVDEIVLGYQQEINRNLSYEIRALYRDQGRSLEDVQVNSIESIQNFYYGLEYGYPLDPFPGFGAAAFGPYILANPGENSPSADEPLVGAEGIPALTRTYHAAEFILTKRFSENWMFNFNFRVSRLKGNYEGLFRNDNGQSDPNITSLADFPLSPLTEGQFREGILNTDRPYVANLYGSYSWDNGITLGGRMTWAAGTPRTPLLAHPIYINSGELPGGTPVYGWWTMADFDEEAPNCGWTAWEDPVCWVTGSSNEFFSDTEVYSALPYLVDYDRKTGRGGLGRTPDATQFDVEFAWAKQFSRGINLRLAATVFDLFNFREISTLDDTLEGSAGIINPDYNSVLSYRTPRYVRVMARVTF